MCPGECDGYGLRGYLTRFSICFSVCLSLTLSLFSSVSLNLCACGWLQEKAKLLHEDIASKRQQV
ncbi:MAG: hypothetical protein ACK55Z_22795 [bacterium]